MNDLQNAVHNSQNLNQIVTVHVANIDAAFHTLLDGDAKQYETDYVDTFGHNGGRVREVWGWSDETAQDEQDWRVHLIENFGDTSS